MQTFVPRKYSSPEDKTVAGLQEAEGQFVFLFRAVFLEQRQVFRQVGKRIKQCVGFSIAQVFTVIETRNEYTGNILIFVLLRWLGSKVCLPLIKFSVHISCSHED